ncbi:MAG: replicative DNA helicase [Actinomycetota bacterium]|nr:replicative DNA helicase [Actinomycetota bacterium]
MAISVPPDAAGKVPPQNEEAEVSVLGAILLSEQALDGLLIDVKLRPEDFYRQRNRLIFGAMIRLKEKTDPEPVDVLTVAEELDRAGELEEAGGTAYVHSLPNLVPAAGNVRHYGRIVKDHALMRRLLDTTRGIQQDVFEFAGEPRELLEQAEGKLYRIAHDEHSGELRSIEAVLHDELEKLERVSREGVSLTGTPSGFNDLDELTGGFQPGNLIVLAARPSMGKCLSGKALVYCPHTGRRRRVEELVAAHERGEEVWVASLDRHRRLRPRRVPLVARNGRKPTFRLMTKLGRRIDATANHPLLTVEGWRRLGELGPGDRIAVPRTLPRTGRRAEMPDHEVVLLAALIADGTLTQRTPCFCFGEGSPMQPLVVRAAAAMGLGLNPGPKGRGTARISAGRGTGPNPLTALLGRHGIWGKASEDKFVPDAIFELDDPQIARFLSVLYGCDGHVYASDRLRQVGYTTISERLARDVQHLLLRLGIVAKIRTLKRPAYDGTGKVAREVLITGQSDLMAFCNRVGAHGKEDRVERLLAGVERSREKTNVDTVPAEVWSQVKALAGDRSMRELSVATGRPPNHNWHVGSRGLSRPRLWDVADWAGDRELKDLAASHVWWDEVVSIEPLGEEETYDLCVPGNENFVADDIVVHNSALVTNIAENASVKHGRPVALFSLEMSETELAQRFIASQAKLNGDDLRKGKVRPDRWPKVMQATETLAAAPLYVDDSSDLGILELRAKTRRLHSRSPLGLVVVDYLQLMRPEDTSVSRVEQIGQISRGLKILARELGIPVIAVSQLSRAVEARPDKKPMLSDLRESGQIEQDADLVMFIFRDEYYAREESERPGEADVIVAKHRNGPVGNVVLTFLERYPKFMNFTRREPDAPVPLEADAP